jgi:hypothetical protein
MDILELNVTAENANANAERRGDRGGVLAKKRDFHFSLGDSSDGPVGFCATIRASSTKQAVEKLKAALPTESMVLENHVEAGVEYIRVDFDSGAVSEADLDDVNYEGNEEESEVESEE